MGFYRGPNIVTAGLKFAIDAGSERSFNDIPTTVEALVIAGGGGGGVGSNAGGGGGAGGVINNTAYSLSSTTSFAITVGAGGAGKTGRGSGTNGANSVFGTLTAVGGGRGGGHPNGGGSVQPNSGGSGGGGAYNSTGAAGTSGQGFAGGTGAVIGGKPTPNDGGGGGGGAGAVGVDAQGSGGPGGNGGAGATYSTSGFSTVYAGGGGGATNDSTSMSTGGTGGGGAGGSNADPNKSGIAGLVNSGSGGGGGNGGGGNSGAGGSGVVIIKYLGIQKATGGTVTTVNGYTIHTFTSSGTFLLVDFVNDLVGTTNGTLENGVDFLTNNGGTFDFDGVDSFINVPNYTAHQQSTGTMEAWINPDVNTSNRYQFSAGSTSPTLGATRALRILNGEFSFVGYGSGNVHDWNGIVAAPANVWQHVAIGWNGTTAYFYLNGVGYSQTLSGLITPTGTLLKVGGRSFSSSGGIADGEIASLKSYSTLLTEAQIKQNFNAQKSRYGL